MPELSVMPKEQSNGRRSVPSDCDLDHAYLRGSRVLVTGATGFIGRRLVRRLVSAGSYVRVLVRPTSNLEGLAGVAEHLKIYHGDLKDADSLQEAVRGAELVFHLAVATGPDWEEIRQATVLGTESLLEGARRSRASRFVYVSSMAVYDYGSMKPGAVVDESAPLEAEPRTRNSYARSKCEAEAAVRRSLNLPDLAVTVVRPGAVYGPGGPEHVPSTMRILAGRLAFAIGGGRRLIPLVYVEDLLGALLRIASSANAAGRIYNIVSDKLVCERVYVSKYSQMQGRPLVVVPLPRLPFLWAAGLYDWASRFSRNKKDSAVLRSLRRVTTPISFSAAATANDLGWSARTELDDGIRACIEEKANALP